MSLTEHNHTKQQLAAQNLSGSFAASSFVDWDWYEGSLVQRELARR